MDDIAGGSCKEAPTAAIDTHSPHSGSPAPSNEETPEAEGVVIVSTLDFHNFGVDRTNVKEDQVWAIYDGKDSMPQFHCLVTKITQEPFNVVGRWLEPIHPLIPFTTFHWLQKLDLACSPGEFRLDHEVEFDTFGTFSHLMAMKRDNTLFEIYSKGFEVCAIYSACDNELPNTNVGISVPKLFSSEILV